MRKNKLIKKRISLEQLAVMVARGFGETSEKFEEIASKLEAVASKEDLESLRKDLMEIKNQMVTKSYLDDKLADLEGSVITRQRKEDHKVNLLIDFLKRKKILGKTEIKMLQEIQVFPTLSRKT